VRRISKLRLVLSCLLTIILILGLCSFAQADNNKNFGAGPFHSKGQVKATGKMIKQLPPGIEATIEAKISVNSQAYSHIDLKIANCTIHGVVYEVYNDTTRPVANALIAARRIGQAEGPLKNPKFKKEKILPPPLHAKSVRWTVYSDVYGAYSLKNLPQGTYSMACLTQWHKPVYALVKVEAGGVVKQDFNLKESYGILKGQVSSPDKNNPARALVLVLSKDSSLVTGELAPWQKNILVKAALYKTKTDQKGFYRIPFVKPGDYFVVAIKNNMYGYEEVKVELYKAGTVNITVQNKFHP